ncbi:peptide chain release factor N(5)-glutamine methyltransferase [Alphaproteobacteria bacterium]|nr:peptide chain release factor N(5)-glutamine methyltransferase [Alphaproteobacteria bacterium]
MFESAGSHNVSDLINQGASLLSKIGIKNSIFESKLMLSKAINVDFKNIILENKNSVELKKIKIFESYVFRRLKMEPVSKIINSKYFWKHEFYVNSDVLDPRPDSETLIEALLENIEDKYKKYKILDMGTGSGALLISLLSEMPNSIGVGIDKSIKAVKIAILNSRKNNVSNRSNFIVMDWFHSLNEKFDIIVCNPPYIEKFHLSTLPIEVRSYDPHLALDGGFDGLDAYRAIISRLNLFLKKSNIVAFEIGYGQFNGIKKLIEASKLKIVGVKQDLAGIERCILVSHKKNIKK